MPIGVTFRGMMGMRELVTTQIPFDTGTSAGNMTNGGGSGGAFNNDTTQTHAQSAQKTFPSGGFTNWTGKDWGAGNDKKITKFILYGPSDTGINEGATATIKLQGSTDNWTTPVDLHAGTNTNGASSQIITIDTGITTTTAYRYHRLIISPGNTGFGVYYAEIQFFEDI